MTTNGINSKSKRNVKINDNRSKTKLRKKKEKIELKFKFLGNLVMDKILIKEYETDIEHLRI